MMFVIILLLAIAVYVWLMAGVFFYAFIKACKQRNFLGIIFTWLPVIMILAVIGLILGV